jgi:uncharacterized MAPEG superfamily protein
MERLVAFGALAFVGLGLLSEVHAERIMHPTGGYSLDFPNGWVIQVVSLRAAADGGYQRGIFLLRSLVWNVATLGIVLILLPLV